MGMQGIPQRHGSVLVPCFFLVLGKFREESAKLPLHVQEYGGILNPLQPALYFRPYTNQDTFFQLLPVKEQGYLIPLLGRIVRPVKYKFHLNVLPLWE